MIQNFAADALSVGDGLNTLGKGLMLGVALGATAIGIGMIGKAYMDALGRNPEAGKSASLLLVLAAMVEIIALLAFLIGVFFL